MQREEETRRTQHKYTSTVRILLEMQIVPVPVLRVFLVIFCSFFPAESSSDHASDPLNPSSEERQALIDLYHEAGGKSWRRSDNWLSSQSICTWYGVTCSNDTSSSSSGNQRVVQFSLYDNLLEGTIPSTLGALTEVNYFALSTNKLSGNIPISLGSTFTKCEYFDLRYNLLNGSFPPGMSNMTKLTHLIMANNEFTDDGGLANIVQKMHRLNYIDVRSNQLSGSAPESLCSLNDVSYCGLVDPKYHTNHFDSIPSCLQSICVV